MLRGFGFLNELLLVLTKINLNNFCCKLSSSKPGKKSVGGFCLLPEYRAGRKSQDLVSDSDPTGEQQ